MATSRSEYAVGASLTLSVDVLWTISNYLASTVLTHGYNKPFAVTYLSTASFVTYLVPFAVLAMCRARLDLPERSEERPWWEHLGFYLPPMHPAARSTHVVERMPRSMERGMPRAVRASSIDGRRPKSDLAVRVELPTSPGTRAVRAVFHRRDASDVHDAERGAFSARDAASYSSDSDAEPSDTSALVSHVVRASELPPLSMMETAVLSAQFAVVWFAANWSFVMSLGYTSVASSTTLGSTSGFFTLLLGSACGTDVFSAQKLGAVVSSFAGVALVAWADSSGAHASTANDRVFGDLLALFSAMCYATYVTLLKVRIGSEDRISMPLFLGFVGVFNIVAFWPVGVLLDWLGVEPFALPADPRMWAGLLSNMAITVVSDFAYLIAMFKSSPLFTTVGLSLTIPMALWGDAVFRNGSLSAQSALGSALVLLGFVAIAWEENKA
ncbi:hypothetical protein MSPP1_002078 [Malassezia sp. CBS 17886]|nr:hypothetical protein MSPP1_002078 [Malassezia sp. CBS 17886]